jgi:hypothetical protein
VIGHITGCFLALRLEVDLQRRLDAHGLAVPWPDLMRDLRQLQAVIGDRRPRRQSYSGQDLRFIASQRKEC